MPIHFATQTLVKLVLGFHPNHDPTQDYADAIDEGRPPPDLKGWSEASASISRALMKQSQETVDVCIEELRKVHIHAAERVYCLSSCLLCYHLLVYDHI